MKKIVSVILVSFFCANLQAQNNLLDIWEQAVTHADIYDYFEKDSMKVIYDTSRPIYVKGKRDSYKWLTDDLIAAGFKFDMQNDTILIVDGYVDYMVGRPTSIYVRSRSSEKAYEVTGRPPYELKPTTISRTDSIVYSTFYAGDVNGFRRLYDEYGDDALGAYNIAWRIVLKNGEIVNPSYMWLYYSMYIWEEYEKDFIEFQKR